MSGNEDRIVDGVKTIYVTFLIPLSFKTIADEYFDLDDMADDEIRKLYETEEQELDDFDVEFTLNSADVEQQLIWVQVIGKAEFWLSENMEEKVTEQRQLRCNQCEEIQNGTLFRQLSQAEIKNMQYYGWICDTCYPRNYQDRKNANDRIWRNLLAGNLKVDRTRSGLPL